MAKLELNGLAKALEDYSVRQILFDTIEYCGAFTQEYNKDPYLTNFLLGRRNIGLWLIHEVEQAGDHWMLLMIREGKLRQEELRKKDGNRTDISDD